MLTVDESNHRHLHNESTLVHIIARIPDGLLLRAALIVYTGTYVLMAWLEPSSRTYQWIADGGSAASVVLVLSLLLLIVMAGDWVINDVMPARFRWHWSLEQRPFIYIWAAAMFGLWLFAAVDTNLPRLLLWQYLGSGLICLVQGLKMSISLRYRYDGLRWLRRRSDD